MSKPDWKDAPEWAQWLARDESGVWYWYENEPDVFDDFWDNRTGLFSLAIPSNWGRWQESLEQRPAVQP